MVTAEQIGTALKRACAAFSLDAAALAARAQLDLETTSSALRGEADVSDLAAVAAALGGSLDDLLAGRRFWEAPSAAFKNAPAASETGLVREALLRVSGAARDRATLVDLLAVGQAPLVTDLPGPVALADDVPAQAERLAHHVRRALGNEIEPIGTIRGAMRRLGVATFLTEFATDKVDGMMWRGEDGGAAAAANVQSRSGKMGALRMTLAHELCHALFDGTKRAPFGMVERRTQHSEGIERRANAFAAYLLAPRDAIRRFLVERGVRPGDEPSASDLRALSQHFLMGVEALAGHLVSCGWWGWSVAHRHRVLVTRDATGEDNEELDPTLAEQAVPIERRGEILDLATLALERGVISIGRWRELVALRASDEWRLLLEERHVARDVEQRSEV